MRHVLEHRADAGQYLYEERITLWLARNMDAAIARAELEASEYCSALGCDDTGIYQAYLLADDPGTPNAGAEVYALMRESALPREEYLTSFFDTGRERQR